MAPITLCSFHMPTNTDIDLLQFDKPAGTEKIPDHLLLGLDRQSGETFGNPASQSLDALLCAAHDGVEIIAHGDAVLLPLEWLYTAYPTRRELWEVQRDALHRYAQKNGLPFTEPFALPGGLGLISGQLVTSCGSIPRSLQIPRAVCFLTSGCRGTEATAPAWFFQTACLPTSRTLTHPCSLKRRSKSRCFNWREKPQDA
jgi:hypothetical protein